MMSNQLQQLEVLGFDEAVETLDQYRNLAHRIPARIIFKFPVGVLPADVLNEYRSEAETLGLSVGFAA